MVMLNVNTHAVFYGQDKVFHSDLGEYMIKYDLIVGKSLDENSRWCLKPQDRYMPDFNLDQTCYFT